MIQTCGVYGFLVVLEVMLVRKEERQTQMKYARYQAFATQKRTVHIPMP